MTYLDLNRLRAIAASDFQGTKPFPWANPEGVMAPEGFRVLRESLPDVSLFTKTVGMEREYGQKSHDRYELKYKPGLPLSSAWQEFIAELSGNAYREEMGRIFGTPDFSIRLQWQYSFRGCSVSPHCDSDRKLGSHIFYFNTPEDWKEEWGGQTLVLDDGGTRDWKSAPELSELKESARAVTMPNRSFIFMRTDHSWHAVGELVPPDREMRKIFTVVFDREHEKATSLFGRIMQKLKG